MAVPFSRRGRSGRAGLSLEHWEIYYRGGALASVPVGADGGYDREIRDNWTRFFAALPDGARILDIGTGNGAVALIAAETARSLGRRFEIHGTDLANIDPRRNVPGGALRFADIQFHPQVATENLPFDSASFAAVSGQYALEYAPIATALAEIRRVLAPGGCAQFILHHAGSVIAGAAHESLAQAELILGETQIYVRLRRYLAAPHSSSAAAERRGRDLAQATEALRAALGRSANPHVLRVTLDAVQGLLADRARLTPAVLTREIDRVEHELRASVRRLRDVVRAAQDEDGMRRIEASAEGAGFRIDQRGPQIHNHTHLVGWLLRLSCP